MSESADSEAGWPPEDYPLVRDLVDHPRRWRIWPAVAVLRWLQRTMSNSTRLVFRSRPSLSFPTSEVDDLRLDGDQVALVLNAPGLATTGSPLPASDIARIVADYHDHGALSAWLDGPGDRFMHLLEDTQMRSNPAYALMTGGRLEAFDLVRDLVGCSTPLSADAEGTLKVPAEDEPEGAVALAGLFLGPISASGLSALFHAFTGLPVRVEEFQGAETETAHPARVGAPMGLMLGVHCVIPAAGVEVFIEGGSRSDAQAWARDAARRRSLHLLASAYIGAPLPETRIHLRLDGACVPPATLGDGSALGGLAVLGRSDGVVCLPLYG